MDNKRDMKAIVDDSLDRVVGGIQISQALYNAEVRAATAGLHVSSNLGNQLYNVFFNILDPQLSKIQIPTI